MNTEERRQRGIELIEKMLGKEGAQQTRDAWKNICPDFERYVTEFLAGEIWSRPNLDLRTKSLVTIATLSWMGRTLGLELNIRMALKNGASRQDIVETFLQIAPYAGFPACWEGLAMAKGIFDEEDKKEGK